MDVIELVYGTLFLLQIVFGVLGNVFLLLLYMHMLFTNRQVILPDLILAHLTLANTMALLSRGVPDLLSAWGLNNFLDDVGCKTLLYIYRASRGLAICTTCLLSVFQSVTISPGTSRWARVKTQLPKCILPSCLFSWILNLLIDMPTPIFVTGPQNGTNINSIIILKYCSSVSIRAVTALVNAVLLSFRDLFFLGLMSVASGHMVLVLHRHHRQVRHLHGPGRSPREMPEVRAAKRVVALVTLYILLYGRDTITLSFLFNMKKISPLILNSNNIMSFTFSAVSPFLMILSDRRVRTFWKRDSPIANWDPS
ncbi:vomeronasal 1 receptor ornAnaV1R3023 [Ornithorhynchus anatinus]|uniref:vomeronasal 1 receptor ornAnaV1R3023 n=1 Tax=Ornithorhynchus anatinus TaxID=9258 RepID=UPI00023AC9D7|nr:vomeronasal 1 receptor ornAnaV1R3023 [Ornithorhynchus anatinus]